MNAVGVSALLLLVAALGCGGGGGAPSPAQAQPAFSSTPEAGAVPARQRWLSVGRFVFAGMGLEKSSEDAPRTPRRVLVPWSRVVLWEKQFDNDGKADLAADVVETPEGDLIVVGVTGPTPCLLGCNVDGWVIKINARGDLLWSRQVGGHGADTLTSVILKGNAYWITGSKYAFPNAYQAWLLEIAPDGQVVWEKTFGGSQDDFAVDAIPTPDGNFLMIGTTRSFGVQDGGDVWLVKLDPDGGMIWSKTYDLGAEDGGTSLIPWGPDRFILTAQSCTANCRDLLTPKVLATYLVVDANGDILKTQIFNEGPKNKFAKIKPTHDGGAVIVGGTSMQEKFPSEDTWIVKLDANADVAWTKIFTSYGHYDGGFDIVQMPDDGYVVAAYSQVYQTPEMDFDNFWMLRLNRTGGVVWSSEWGGPDNDDLRAVTLCTDGGVVLAGFKDSVSWPLTAFPGPADVYVSRVYVP
ncbi:MAG: hypothetical protein ACP5NF_07135 [Thermoanaerobaculum sp.]